MFRKEKNKAANATKKKVQLRRFIFRWSFSTNKIFCLQNYKTPALIYFIRVSINYFEKNYYLLFLRSLKKENCPIV